MRRYSKKASILVSLLLIMLLAGCGGAVSGPPAINGGSNTLAITTSTLPDGQIQASYQVTLVGTGGTQPYTWSITSGLLPQGLTLTAGTGVIAGTPTETGQFSFTIELRDSSQSSPQTTTKALNLTISDSTPGTVTVSISPAIIPVTVGASQQFDATVSGTSNTAVTWLVNNVEGGSATTGTISTSGLYTAPASVPTPASVTVTARSVADTSKTANAAVTIVESGSEPGLDIYSGCEVCGIAGQATGFFHVEKINGRWWFIDPLGNPFWARAVYNIDINAVGSTVDPKYGSPFVWAKQVINRMKAWGFNTTGEYADNRVRPYGTWGGGPLAVEFRLPAIAWNTATSLQSLLNSRGWIPEPVYDIIAGVPTSTYGDFRAPLMDVYDPDYAVTAQKNMEELNLSVTGGLNAQDWIIGISIDDADQMYGFKGDGSSGRVPYPHPAFMVLATNPVRGGADPTVYSKLALRDFLQTKYSTLSMLNAAWGSTYTSWDSDGGYGTGSGLLDEDGNFSNHPWVGSDPFDLSNTNPQVRADLDDFLFEFATQYFRTLYDTIKSVDQNHLVFGPTAIGMFNGKVREPIIRAAVPYVDVFQFGYDHNPLSLADPDANLVANYDMITDSDPAGKPVVIWTGETANADSPLAGFANPFSMASAPTQEERALIVAFMIDRFVSVQGTDGTAFVVGYDFWAWADSLPEKANWGLITTQDNAYDGIEAVIAAGTDPWGFPTGGEAANYGDFLTTITNSNKNIYCAITGQNCN